MKQDIRQRILDAAPKKLASKDEVPPTKSSRSFWGISTTIALGICIMVFSLATMIAMYNKKTSTAPAPTAQKTPNGLPSYATKGDLDAAINKVNTRMDLWAHRIWLLAVANNENVNLRKKFEAQTTGTSENRYIYFDEEWRINRFPDTMELTDKQKQDLQKDHK